MAEAMDDIKDYEFIAIFDADFHPEPDFLLKCIPYLKDNSDVGFVQARWTYANGNEVCLVGGCAAMSRRALTNACVAEHPHAGAGDQPVLPQCVPLPR